MPKCVNSPSLFAVSLAVGLLVLPYPCISSGDYAVYVKPFQGTTCPGNDSVPCKTLDEYANNAGDLDGNVTMLFLAGVHKLTTNLTLDNLTSFLMRPASFSNHTTIGNDITIQLFSSNLMFASVLNGLTLERLTISSRGEQRESVILRNSPATLRQLHVVGVTVTFLADADNDNNNDIVLSFTIKYSNIEGSSGTGIQVKDKRSKIATLNFMVIKSNISRHLQGGVVINSASSLLTVTIINSMIDSNNITISGNSAFNAAGLSVYSTRSDSTRVCIMNSQFINNRDLRAQANNILQDLKGHSTVVYVLRAVVVEVADCEFINNQGTPIGAVNIANNLRLFGNVTFQGNTAQQGGALALVSTLVYFLPPFRVILENNAADDVGGAIYVDSGATLYQDSNSATNVDCFYKFPDFESPNIPNSIVFTNNTATNGGHHIYGASLLSYCVVYNKNSDQESNDLVRSIDKQVQMHFEFDQQTVSPISSNPSRVCVIDEEIPQQSPSEYCADKSQIFKVHTAFPGEEVHFEAVLTGAEFGTGTGAVYAQFLPSGGIQPSLQSSYQYSQRIRRIDTSQTIHYSVLSNNSYEVLVLTAVDSTISSNGDESEIESAIQEFKETNIIPSILLTTPVYINISLLRCPPGFYLHPTSLRCECNPRLCNAQVNGKFSNGTGLIYLGENVWVSAYSNAKENVSGIILHQNCPFDYCTINKAKGIDLNESDTQCAMNHAGILCGRCESGFSIAIGSNNCLPCSDSNRLLLLFFFAAAGFLLVFFIKFLNMTVSQGTISGLIFYANIIWAYQSIFLPSTFVVKYRFFYIFLAWINLDFGFETCFIKGLTAFWKTWLQFLFPLYIWVIAGGIILVAHCSKRMTKLFGNNSVQVLATLFLLSYAKLLRTAIAVLYPATLHVYTDDGQMVRSLTRLVWALDGNLLYGRVPHIFLLLVVVLVILLLWLPYTFTLLFIQLLRRNSKLKCLRWVNRMKPLIDAYIGPLNPQNYHWVGLLLLARFILFLTFTSTYANDPFACLLSLAIVLVTLLVFLSYTGQLYDNPMRFSSHYLPKSVSFRSILEVTFLFNLAIVAVIVLYLRDNIFIKEIVVCTSVGITVIQFIGIVLFHIVIILKNVLCNSSFLDIMNKWKLRKYKNKQGMAVYPTRSSVSMSENDNSSTTHDYYESSYESAQYRELLLAGSTSLKFK